MEEFDRQTEPLARMGLLTSMFIVHRALYAMAKLNLADYMNKGPVTIKDLAHFAGADQRALYRLLRMLVAIGAVKSNSRGDFELTELGKTLRKDRPDSLHSWAVFSGEPFYQQCWDEIVESIRTGRPVWEKTHDSSMFDYFSSHPDHSAIFDAAMTESSRYIGPALTKAYDFSKLDSVVDVGGGRGMLLAQILKANPRLRGILYDLAHVVQSANSYLDEEGVISRCKVFAGSFFEELPKGGDAYILKWVLHDWDDEHSLKILENCRKAMKSSAKLLILENIMPRLEVKRSASSRDFINATLSDLEMLVILGGEERTKEEYESLLNRSGFRLEGIKRLGAGDISIIQASPKKLAQGE